jgi:hypothetical protein
MSKKKCHKGDSMKLYITGIDAVSKFIDALTTKQADQFIVVRTDEYQSHLSSDKRGFIVEIYDNESHYIEAWDLNDKTYTLDEAKKLLGVLDETSTDV